MSMKVFGDSIKNVWPAIRFELCISCLDNPRNKKNEVMPTKMRKLNSSKHSCWFFREETIS